MKFLAILLLASSALAQQPAQPPAAAPPAAVTPSGPAQLPIKTGEWKMTAIVHGKDNDLTRTFFTCVKQNDLAKLVPQGEHLPKDLTCNQDSQTVTTNGIILAVTCKSPQATVHTTYDLKRSTDSLVTGTMQMDLIVNENHAESSTSIVFEWQKDVCTAPEPVKPPAPATTPSSPPPTLGAPAK
jgi:hypothetical protein